jgi:hypothetical protein
MASLRHKGTRRSVFIDSEIIVGRSRHCRVRLEDAQVSFLHASIRWSPGGWEIKDLASTNGTFVNGARLEYGQIKKIGVTDALAFGSVSETWELADPSPPRVSVVCEDGTVLATDGDLLAVPSPEEPTVTLYRSSQGAWLIERSGGDVAPLADHGEFRAGEKNWVLRLGEPGQAAQIRRGGDVRAARFVFDVSSDEEHVDLSVHLDDVELTLGSHIHNCLLLTLARRRLSDLAHGVSAASAGWLYLDELERALGSDAGQLNVQVFRIRKRLGRYFSNAAEVIERRFGSQQLRVGVSAIEVRRR